MVVMKSTLHIEHPVRDFDTWKTTFDGFHDFRVEHGVRSYRVARGVEADSRVTIDLVFDNADAASTFHRLLVERVWSRQQAADVLTEAPSAVVLNLVEDATVSP
jgi:hypothetical protein